MEFTLNFPYFFFSSSPAHNSSLESIWCFKTENTDTKHLDVLERAAQREVAVACAVGHADQIWKWLWVSFLGRFVGNPLKHLNCGLWEGQQHLCLGRECLCQIFTACTQSTCCSCLCCLYGKKRKDFRLHLQRSRSLVPTCGSWCSYSDLLAWQQAEAPAGCSKSCAEPWVIKELGGTHGAFCLWALIGEYRPGDYFSFLAGKYFKGTKSWLLSVLAWFVTERQ